MFVSGKVGGFLQYGRPKAVALSCVQVASGRNRISRDGNKKKGPGLSTAVRPTNVSVFYFQNFLVGGCLNKLAIPIHVFPQADSKIAPIYHHWIRFARSLPRPSDLIFRMEPECCSRLLSIAGVQLVCAIRERLSTSRITFRE